MGKLQPREQYGEKVIRSQYLCRGDRVRQLRTQKNMTQQTLAELCEIKRAMITNIENHIADPSLGVLLLLAQALDTTTDYLLGYSGGVQPNLDVDEPLPFE